MTKPAFHYENQNPTQREADLRDSRALISRAHVLLQYLLAAEPCALIHVNPATRPRAARVA
jgi:hypothetical protein